MMKESIKEIDLIKEVITGVRNIRGEMNIPPKKDVKIIIDVKRKKEKEIFKNNLSYITNLAKVESVELVSDMEKPDSSATYVFSDIQVHVLLKGLINYDDERKRIYKGIKRLRRKWKCQKRNWKTVTF